MIPMSAVSSSRSVYAVETPVFTGPLDLLLQLIERAELDITKLALAHVTDQFLEHMENISDQVTEELSAFLVIAAKMVQIKSEALLPRPVVREPGEEDPGEDLANQLIIYKRFKEIAEILALRQSEGLRTYLRLAPPSKVEERVDLSGIQLADLVLAAQSAFSTMLGMNGDAGLSRVISANHVTIRQKIDLIYKLLQEHGRTTFRTLLENAHSRLEIVVTFLALLELVKSHLVEVRQDSLFSDIQFEAAELWDSREEFELEFGE
jgi:segregation and condensation protein A